MALDDTPKGVEELSSKVGKLLDDVRSHGEELKGRLDKGDKVTAELKGDVDKLLTELNTTKQAADEAKARMDELEQKAARRGKQGEAQKSIGQRFIETEEVKAMAARPSGKSRASMEVKATITSATTDSAGSAGDGVNETRLPGIVGLPDRRMTVRDLLTPGRMDGSTLEYVKETGFTNSAATVAEAATKPESDLKFDLVTTSAKVIAHWVKASRQILDDFNQLQSYIDYRLRYGLAYVEEQQLLNGDGTGQNLNGLVTQATAYSAPSGLAAASPTAIDTLRIAMLQVALAEYPASGIVIHPTDWARIELTKDGDARYLVGNPQSMVAPRLWGLPVVATQAMAVDKFLVGAFRLGAQVFDRWLSRVEISTENQDDFIKNLVTVLAEERLALAVYRPEAFVYGDLGYVA